MKKIWRFRKIIAGFAFLCVILIGFVQSSQAQFMGYVSPELRYNMPPFISREARPRWFDRYENFSNYDLREYEETLLEYLEKRVGRDKEFVNPVWHGTADPVSFDRFGNFLMPGGDIYNMTWDKSTVGANKFYGDNAANIFENLMISSDEFSNWETKFMIGRNLRAYFTPSTLKRTNFDGIRWDASSRKNSFTFLASVGDRPTSDYDRRPTHFNNLFGAYWQSILGDVLKLGGSFVTRQRGTQSYSNKDIDTGFRGINEKEMPRYMYVVITDDSPEDATNGTRVYDVKAIVNGKEANIPKRAYKIDDVINIFKFTDMKVQNQYLFSRKESKILTGYYGQQSKQQFIPMCLKQLKIYNIMMGPGF